MAGINSIWRALYFYLKTNTHFASTPSFPPNVAEMGCCFSEPVDFDGEVNLYHFELHRAVGKGAFGKVSFHHHSVVPDPHRAHRSASSNTNGRKSSMPSSTSTRHGVLSRRPSPTLSRSGGCWKRSVVRATADPNNVSNLRGRVVDRPPLRRELALCFPGRRELFLRVRPDAGRGSSLCVRPPSRTESVLTSVLYYSSFGAEGVH